MPGKLQASRTNGLTLVLVSIASLSLETARVEWVFARWPHVASLIAVLAAMIVVSRWLERVGVVDGKINRASAWLLASFLSLGLLQEGVFRLFGWGQDLNFAALDVVRNVMCLLAALHPWPRLPRLGVAMSLFLVLGSASLATNAAAHVVALVYGMLGLWWLLGTHWETLESHFPSSTRRQIPKAVAATFVAVVLLCTLAGFAVLRTTDAISALPGFLPTSGGERWNSDYATRGVNDGDDLVAAEKDADSFGAIESQVFLESEMPSLYDMFNDIYGDEAKKPKSDRAIALASPNLQQEHRHLSESQKSGREFSLVRRPHDRTRRALDKRPGEALLYVSGRVPLHLGLESYDHFDGASWRQSEQVVSVVRLELQAQQEPWFVPVRPFQSSALAESELHQIKLIRLATNRIPTPAHLMAAHINKVDQADFMGWTNDGMLEMPSHKQVPPLTVAHLQSRPLEVARLTSDQFSYGSLASRSAYLQLPDSDETARITSLAQQWTAGVPRGWPQITRVTEKLRAEFVLDRSSKSSTSPGDVEAFLFESHRGPDYLFATSAAMMLRSLGYPARVVSGFYADPQRYDSRSRLTPVLPEDVHFWVEMAVDGGTWATVEPSPGYEVLAPPQPWWRRALASARGLLATLLDHPTMVLLAVVLATLTYVGRGHILDISNTVLWYFTLLVFPTHSTSSTMRLIERRAAIAGMPRSPVKPIVSHYLNIAEGFEAEDRELLQWLIRTVGRQLYGPSATSDDRETQRLCRQVAHRLTVSQFRSLLRPSRESCSPVVLETA